VARPRPDADDDTQAEFNSVAPYLDLAREIRDVVAAFAIDDTADVDVFVEAIEGIPKRERAQIALTVFDQLPPDRRWSILERTFGDVELRQLLVGERQRVLDEIAQRDAIDTAVRVIRLDHRLDLSLLGDGVEVVLGLFRSAEVRAALDRGSESQVCAREVVVRTEGPAGQVRVIADVFNPRRGYFVTREYDEKVWESERLVSHSTVTLGSSAIERSGENAAFEPVLYPGGRVDAVVGDDLKIGHLHLGFALLGNNDLFVAPR
jgi:hypothetical protein